MAAFVFDEFVFDDVRYQLARAGVTVKADTQVLELLAHLLKNPGRVVTKEELIHEIWQGRALGDNVISVCVAKLRKALGGASNRCIGNVYGRGYRFMRPVTKRDSEPDQPRLATGVAPSVRRTDMSLVGRSVAMTQLEAALDNARRGRGGVVALLGEAGIGKTRLAEALEARAPEAGFHVAWGHCHPFGDVPPLWPFLQVLRSWGVQLPAAAHAGERDADGDDPREQSTDTWHETVLFMAETWTARCARQPQLIVLEDVQWADSASLQMLSHLITTIGQLPGMIVVTVRDGQLPQEPRARRVVNYVLGHRDCTRIPLTRLGKDDVEAYTSALFGSADAAITDAVFAKSEGNPFFMVELLRPFSDGEKPQPNELTLSGPALDIVRQTLQQLARDTRAVLTAASVIGRSFDLGLLSAVSEQTPDALIELLEPAMSSHVIIAQRDSHTHFAFGHDLIRDVLYEDQSSIARARLHLKVADALEARQASAATPASTELAHHLLAALPASDVSRAIDAAQQAARAANRIGAYSDACVLLRRAREALHLRPEIEPRTACALLYDLARYERGAGAPTFAAHLEQAVALARRHGLADILVDAAQLVAGAPGTITTEGSVDILEAALQALPESDRAQRAMLLAHLSWSAPYSWDKRQVGELLDRAQSLSQSSGNAAVRTVLRAMLFYAAGPDDHERAFTLADDMERSVAARGQRQRARWALEPELTRVLVLFHRGELSQAQRALDGFGEAARELRHAELLWHYDRLCAIMRMNTGDLAYARTRLTELNQRASQLQLHGHKVIERLDWGELHRLTTPQGPVPSSAAALLRPLPNDGPLAHMVKLRLMAQLGLRSEAAAELGALPVERIRQLPKSRDYLVTLGHVAHAAVETRSLAHATALYDALAPYPHFCMASLAMHCHGVVSRTLGALANVLGRRAQAVQHYDNALIDAEKFGLLPQLSETRFEYAQLLASGDPSERARARELVGRALDVARALGMKPLALESEKFLGGAERARAEIARP